MRAALSTRDTRPPVQKGQWLDKPYFRFASRVVTKLCFPAKRLLREVGLIKPKEESGVRLKNSTGSGPRSESAGR